MLLTYLALVTYNVFIINQLQTDGFELIYINYLL